MATELRSLTATSSHSPFDGKAFLSTVANAPGVYVMFAENSEVLYVGKARALKKRLASYFRTTRLAPKTAALMQHVVRIDTTVTHTESEALLLENNLIKTHKPHYNVVLRDDKSYPYIRLSHHQDFPRLSFYRGSRRGVGRYFGPYPSASTVRETLSQLQKIFPIRQCEDTFFRNRSRPCLQHQIKRCTAPCVGLVDKQEYQDDVEQAVMFLEGGDKSLIERLVGKMEHAAKNMEYELAAQYRDRIATLNRIQERQYVSGHYGDADVVAVVIERDQVCIELVTIRAGRNLGSRHFFQTLALDMTEAQVLEAFLPQHYLVENETERSVPSEILLSHKISQPQLLINALAQQAGQRVVVKHNIRGHRLRWMQRAMINAKDVLRRQLAGRATQTHRFTALQDALNLAELPSRIECFDISHTMGEKTVASCVVFGTDGPIKSDYRRFNISGIQGGDDYAAMSQALQRRYSRLRAGEGVLPDILLIDGGKGQVRVAVDVLEELQVVGVLIIGVAKGPARKAGAERLFLFRDRLATILDAASPALHLIQQVRDEAHRFAITGHRQRRAKARTRSILEDIPGVGEKRRQALLKHLGGLQEVIRAGVEDLASVPGVNSRLAQRIYEQLHQ